MAQINREVWALKKNGMYYSSYAKFDEKLGGRFTDKLELAKFYNSENDARYALRSQSKIHIWAEKRLLCKPVKVTMTLEEEKAKKREGSDYCDRCGRVFYNCVCSHDDDGCPSCDGRQE